LDLGWIDMGTRWGPSCFDAICHLLATRAITTAVVYNSAFRRFALDVLCRKKDLASLISLSDAEAVPQVMPISYWENIRCVLRIIQFLRLPGVDDDLFEFLDNPEKWEEAEKGWYVALLTNDPRRGALTEQELSSILNGVTRAYQEGRISEGDYAVVMFFVSTGVRPIQVARMRASDVLITPGAEQQEVTLTIPLAKGRRQKTEARWKRRAPTQLAEILIRYNHMPQEAFIEAFVRMGEAAPVRIEVLGPLKEKVERRALEEKTTKEEALKLEIGCTHSTRFGICRHNYAMSLCPRDKDCISCGENLFIAHDERQLAEARTQLAIHENAARRCRNEIANGDQDAQKWLDRHEHKAARWRLAIEEITNPLHPPGMLISLPPNATSQTRAGLAQAIRDEEGIQDTASDEGENILDIAAELLAGDGG
jgi:hypothetical protein